MIKVSTIYMLKHSRDLRKATQKSTRNLCFYSVNKKGVRMDTLLTLLHIFKILYSNYIWVKSYGIQNMVECSLLTLKLTRVISKLVAI